MQPDSSKQSKNLKTAIETMEMAVAFFNLHKKNKPVVLDQEAKEIKLELDKQVETLISTHLEKESPYAILGEENGSVGVGTGGQWVIDPLDGTYNFSRNLLPYCISIGLMMDGKPVLGVIYDFNSNSIFYGEKGYGAFKNGEKISVADKPIEQAALCTGFPIGFNKSEITSWYENVERFKKIRMYGSACYSLLQVAQGTTDAYFEKGIFLWDVAAGLAIIEAAGGTYQIEKTAKEFKLNVYAGNKNLHKWFGLDESEKGKQ